jgi:hypothetical protein
MLLIPACSLEGRARGTSPASPQLIARRTRGRSSSESTLPKNELHESRGKVWSLETEPDSRPEPALPTRLKAHRNLERNPPGATMPSP